MAIVKANAYGHGVATVVRAISGTVEMFGVATVTEAEEVRELDLSTPIFILGPALPGERTRVVAGGHIPAVSSVEEARDYSRLAMAAGHTLPIHLKIDTGMGRIGIWMDDARAGAAAIRALPGLQLTALASHLPVADEDDRWTRDQLARFHALVADIRADAPGPLAVHVHNSAGLIGFPMAAGDLVRPGLMLYGSAPRTEFQPHVRPVLTWKARISLVRDVGPGRTLSYGRTFLTPHAMRVATLAVGYADGYPRQASGQGAEVLIRGHRCAILGRVTMDQILADVSALPRDVVEGEEAVLVGTQGSETILAAHLATWGHTIAWDIFTGIGSRVMRTTSKI